MHPSFLLPLFLLLLPLSLYSLPHLHPFHKEGAPILTLTASDLHPHSGELAYHEDEGDVLLVEDTHFLFLGDSTTSKLTKQFKEHHKDKNIVIGRCELNKAYGIPSTKNWMKPRKGEGPVSYGKKHPNCLDSRSSSLIQPFPILSPSSPPPPPSSFQVLMVDSARDVALQTPNHTTTQEALLFEFLAPRYAHLKNVVVFLNVGLHDAAFDGQSDELDKFYERNLRWFLFEIRKALPLATIIWHSLTITKGDNPQTLGRMERFNSISHNMMRRNNIPMIDCWNASQKLRHLLVDNVHHRPSFYHHKAEKMMDFVRLLHQYQQQPHQQNQEHQEEPSPSSSFTHHDSTPPSSSSTSSSSPSSSSSSSSFLDHNLYQSLYEKNARLERKNSELERRIEALEKHLSLSSHSSSSSPTHLFHPHSPSSNPSSHHPE